jgi:hypothetical protein
MQNKQAKTPWGNPKVGNKVMKATTGTQTEAKKALKQLRIYTLQSLSPGMLQNPKTEALLDSLRTGKRLPAKKDWTIQEESSTKLYRSANGKMGVPMQNIIASLMSAGQSVALKGKKMISTAKSTKLYDFLDFRTEFCEFLECDKDGNVPWTPFMIGGVMHQGANGVAVAITRPRIAHWTLDVPVIYDSEREVSEKSVDQLFEIAGRTIGICDWRPMNKGRFGRFVVKKVTILPIQEEKNTIENVLLTAETASPEILALAGVS